MSLVVDKRSEATVASVQQTAADHRALVRELQEARETIARQTLTITRLEHTVAKQNNEAAAGRAERQKLQFALDAVVKELAATKGVAADMAGLSERLRRDLEKWAPAAVTSSFSTSSHSMSPSRHNGAAAVLRNYSGGGGSGSGATTALSTTALLASLNAHSYGNGTSPLTPSRPPVGDGSRSAPRPNARNSPTNTLAASAPAAAEDSCVDNANEGAAAGDDNNNSSTNIHTTNAATNANKHGVVADGNSPTSFARQGTINGINNTFSNNSISGNGNSNGGAVPNILLALYLQKCLDAGVSAHPLVVKSLHRCGGGGLAGGDDGDAEEVGAMASAEEDSPHRPRLASRRLVAGSAAEPISYVQLLLLIEAFAQRKYASPAEAQSWAAANVTRLEVVCFSSSSSSQPSSPSSALQPQTQPHLSSSVVAVKQATDGREARALVSDLINLCAPSLTSLLVSDVDDAVAAPIAGAIAAAPLLSALELPSLAVTDVGMRVIMKVIINRDVAAAAAAGGTSPLQQQQQQQRRGSGAEVATYNGYTAHQITLGASSMPSPYAHAHHPSAGLVAPPIALADLDLSQTHLTDGDTFFLIKGAFIRAISFRNCAGLLDKFLGEVIASSPNLERLDLSNCSSLTQDAVLYLRQAKKLQRLALSNCAGMHTLRLGESVVELATDFKGVTHFSAPGLERFAAPLTAFSCVSFECPNLKEITIANTTLSAREFGLLGDCTSIESAHFINCRTESGGLQAFLKRMRRLRRLSVRRCKGITDADVAAIGPTVEELDLSDCYCLTDKALQASIGPQCRGLRRLTLKRCSGISDVGLFFLSQCPLLEFLNLLGMRKVSVEGIRRLCLQLSASPTSTSSAAAVANDDESQQYHSSSPPAAAAPLCPIEHIIHETFVSSTIRVDRTDDEEGLREQNAAVERAVVHRRQNEALNYDSRVPLTSPRHSQQQQHQMGGTISSSDHSGVVGGGGGYSPYATTYNSSTNNGGNNSPSRAAEAEGFNGWTSNVRNSTNNSAATAVRPPSRGSPRRGGEGGPAEEEEVVGAPTEDEDGGAPSSAQFVVSPADDAGEYSVVREGGEIAMEGVSPPSTPPTAAVPQAAVAAEPEV